MYRMNVHRRSRPRLSVYGGALTVLSSCVGWLMRGVAQLWPQMRASVHGVAAGAGARSCDGAVGARFGRGGAVFRCPQPRQYLRGEWTIFYHRGAAPCASPCSRCHSHPPRSDRPALALALLDLSPATRLFSPRSPYPARSLCHPPSPEPPPDVV
ncbi:hypothetical protein B0H14DRAFT_2908691, partial [Mycena olivaceomarginata]